MHESPGELIAVSCGGTKECEQLDLRAVIASGDCLLFLAKDLGYHIAAVPAKCRPGPGAFLEMSQIQFKLHGVYVVHIYARI